MVMFLMLLDIAKGTNDSFAPVFLLFLQLTVGGVAYGIATGFLISFALKLIPGEP